MAFDNILSFVTLNDVCFFTTLTNPRSAAHSNKLSTVDLFPQMSYECQILKVFLSHTVSGEFKKSVSYFCVFLLAFTLRFLRYSIRDILSILLYCPSHRLQRAANSSTAISTSILICSSTTEQTRSYLKINIFIQPVVIIINWFCEFGSMRNRKLLTLLKFKIENGGFIDFIIQCCTLKQSKILFFRHDINKTPHNTRCLRRILAV